MSLIWTTEMEVATKYQSHLPALLACIVESSGPVIEFGAGHFSTPVLHSICAAMKRELFSVEKDDEWREYFRARYESETHHFDPIVDLCLDDIGVTFIDDSPGGENRAQHFKDFIDVSDFVVVHDYHAENEEAIRPLLAGVSYTIHRKYFPPTLVATKRK